MGHAIRAALRDVTAVLKESDEPLTGRAIELVLAGSEHSRANIRRGLALGIRNRLGPRAAGPPPLDPAHRAKTYRNVRFQCAEW